MGTGSTGGNSLEECATACYTNPSVGASVTFNDDGCECYDDCGVVNVEYVRDPASCTSTTGCDLTDNVLTFPLNAADMNLRQHPLDGTIEDCVTTCQAEFQGNLESVYLFGIDCFCYTGAVNELPYQICMFQ